MSEMKRQEKGPNLDTEEIKLKGKKRRSSKKSLKVESERRQKFLQTLLKCSCLPTYTMEVLRQEEKERGHIYKLSTEDVSRIWEEVLVFVKEKVAELLEMAGTGDNERRDGVHDLVSAVIGFLQYTALFHSVVEDKAFVQMAVVLNLAMTHKDACSDALKNKICELSEYCCIKELRLPGEFYLDTFNFLFDLTLDESRGTDMKSEVKRMWEMHVPLSRINLRTQSSELIVSKLARVVVSPAYLACKEGRQFIAFTFTLDVKFIKKFHQAVKDFLPKCKRPQAVVYGEVYYSAWVNGSTEVRQMLETHCIQDLMTHMFLFRRKRQEISHLGQMVFAILSYLHQHRTIPHFSKTLTELYMPLLWRHLRSGNNVERCNAAEVFLDIYPLEKLGSGKAEESDFLNKQHNEMVDLLTDNCHIVRIIAIKGICEKLCSAWCTFPQESIQVLMRNLIALADDGSDANVRRTLYDSLRVLLHNPDSAAYLARVLPSLCDHIHDENEKVRLAFIKLLCAVKSMPDPAPIKYWKIVPIQHLAVRLELEKYDVGSVLSKLLMSNIYSAEVGVDKFLLRLIKFIEISPQAARKLFQYSYKVLDYKSAVRVMLTILLNLRAHVKKKGADPSQPEEEERKVVPRAKSRRKKSRLTEPLQPENSHDESGYGEDKENISRPSNSTADSEVKEDMDEYSRPGVAHALVDIVSLLWSLHCNQLADPDNEEDHNNLVTMACAGIPLFLKYYKGGPIYFAVIHLASLVPATKLTPVSTVCSACLSHLKQVYEMTPQAEIDVIIHALCSWNRFADIQDIVIDWLDQAFRCEGLNQSQAPLKEERQRKVRFVAQGGKPMLALRLLDAVFVHPADHRRVVDKTYNHVYELFVYMERIKVVVERRVLGGLPLDSPMLSDEFLLKCMYRYTKLILALHRPELQDARDNQTVIEPFDASNVFLQLLEWTMRVIRPMIPERLVDEPDISVMFLNDIMRTGANLVDINYCNRATALRLAELARSLISSDCSLWFVRASIMIIKHLKDYSEATYGVEDDAKLMRAVIPSLLSEVVRSLSETKYTKEQIASSVENVVELKTVMLEVIQCLQRMFGPQSRLLQTVLRLFTDAVIAIIVQDVKQLQVLDTVDKVQELPFVCGLLLSVVSKPTITPLWLATIPASIDQLYSHDSNVLVATVSLLYTLAHFDTPLPKDLLCTILRKAYEVVSNYPSEPTPLDSQQSDSFLSTHSIDVKKVATPVLQDLALFLNCSLR